MRCSAPCFNASPRRNHLLAGRALFHSSAEHRWFDPCGFLRDGRRRCIVHNPRSSGPGDEGLRSTAPDRVGLRNQHDWLQRGRRRAVLAAHNFAQVRGRSWVAAVVRLPAKCDNRVSCSGLDTTRNGISRPIMLDANDTFSFSETVRRPSSSRSLCTALRCRPPLPAASGCRHGSVWCRRDALHHRDVE